MQLAPSVLRLTRVLGDILRTMDRYERTALSRAALTSSQARVLSAVASQRETQLTELSRSLEMSKSTLSSSIENLERLGLLTRTRKPDDRRVYPIRLTERGRALARRVRMEREQTLGRAAADLTPYQRKTLASALEALQEALARTGRRSRR